MTAAARFSAFLTKCHWPCGGRKSNQRLEFVRFPQIHSAHHNKAEKREPLSTRSGEMFNLSQKPQVIPLRSASEAKG